MTGLGFTCPKCGMHRRRRAYRLALLVVLLFARPACHAQDLPPNNGPAALESNIDGGTAESMSVWWLPYVATPMRQTSQPLPLSIEQVITLALQHSHQLRVLSDEPLVRDTAILEADGAFDWAAFVETMWNDITEPVGSQLTTGGPPRYQDHKWTADTGLRRRMTTGGKLELNQRFGFENSNSRFFLPNNQGTTRLSVSYTQPLLRGSGKPYNTSLILLAQIDADASRDEFARELQDQLLEISRAYWTLHRERATLLQRQRLYHRAQLIMTDLEHRSTIDAVQSQIVRARAAVAARKADLFRAAAAVKNAEGRIRSLVNAPSLGKVDEYEFLPVDMPTVNEFCIDMPNAITMALQNRPEIHQAMKQIKASSVRLNMSHKELLPALDLVMESYVNGLQDDSDIGAAYFDQFSTGAPSYRAGLQFEVPLRNRVAKARFERRAIETRQLESQLQATMESLAVEAEIAVRDVETTFLESRAKLDSVKAAESQVEYLTERWRLLAGEDRSASLILEDLLSAQERLANQEADYLESQVRYNFAITNLKRATGTLLQMEQVRIDRAVTDGGIPAAVLSKELTASPDSSASDTLMEYPSTDAAPITPQTLPPDTSPATPLFDLPPSAN